MKPSKKEMINFIKYLRDRNIILINIKNYLDSNSGSVELYLLEHLEKFKNEIK
jgi:hypothetical protein